MLLRTVSISKSSGFQKDLRVDACGCPCALGMNVFEVLKPALLLPFKEPISLHLPHHFACLTLNSRCAIPAISPQPLPQWSKLLMDGFAIDCLPACYSSSVPSLLLSVCFWLLSLYPLYGQNPNPPSPFPLLKKSSILQFGKGLGGLRLTFTHSSPELRKSLASCPLIPALQIALSLSSRFPSLFFFLPLYLYTRLVQGMRGIIA